MPTASTISDLSPILSLSGDVGISDPGNWQDQSGSVNNAVQSIVGKQPSNLTGAINGKGAKHFDGVDDVFTLNAVSLSEVSVLAVCRTTSDSMVLGSSVANYQVRNGGPSNLLSTYDGDTSFSGTSDTTSALSSFSLIRYEFTNGTSRFWQGSKFLGAAGCGVMAVDCLGAILKFNGLFLSGDIASIDILPIANSNSGAAFRSSYYNLPFTAAYANSPNVNIVFVGDSLTFQGGASVGGTNGSNYPSQTLIAIGPQCTGINLGVNGKQLVQMVTDAPSQSSANFVPGKTNIAVLVGGHNDYGAGASSATVVSRMYALADTWRAAGYKVVIATETPAAYSSYPANFDALRDASNASYRTGYSAHADALADVASDSIMGPDGAENNSTYFLASDKTHWTDAGCYRVGVLYVAPTILGLIYPNVTVTALHTGGFSF